HPGGNTTGLATSEEDTAPKQLQFLLMAAPKASRIGYLVGAPSPEVYRMRQKMAQALSEMSGRMLVIAEVRNPADITGAFAGLVNERAEALLVGANSILFSQRQQVADLAMRNRLPSMFVNREYAEAGGLMSYGESIADFYRRAAFYVDKIFKGAKPSDLPVQQPTRFFLTINRKTAEMLGLTIPLELHTLADEVIE